MPAAGSSAQELRLADYLVEWFRIVEIVDAVMPSVMFSLGAMLNSPIDIETDVCG